MRQNVLRDLASRAAKNPEFLRHARQDIDGALARGGYHLTEEELGLVQTLLRKTAGMSDYELARLLDSGLRERAGSPPTRPAAPSWRGSEPERPGHPGNKR